MAVVNLKSTNVTNLDAGPPVKNPSWADEGIPREKIEVIAVTNGDSIASTYRMFRVHSSERVSALEYFCDAITSAAADVGLYDTAANGGLVVSAQFFASAVSLASALVVPTPIQYEANTGAAVISNRKKRVWEQLSLTADPNKFYDVTIALTAAATATGNVALGMRSVRPSA